MAQQPLGDWGGGHVLLLLLQDFYLLVMIMAMAVAFPFTSLLCLSHLILKRPEG